ncbi:hypothetical protein ACIOWE_11720 [Pseudomonas sp. NPDC087598]|uniref:hypothetical protein n=1 Tax=Pseudomonas sp. NPDC087598 TaxID=3364440 RepID=UPI003827A40B
MNKSIETADTFLTWKQQFRPHINGKRVRWDDLNVVLMKGEKCTLELEYELSYYIGEPDGFLVLDYKPGEEGQRLVSDPPLGVECEMADGSLSLSWTISAVEGPGGVFELEFTLPRDPQISESPPVPGRVIENWSEGFVPWVNGQRVSWSGVKLDLMQGETCTLALSYEGSSLIGDPAGFLALDYMPGAEGRGLVFNPPLGVACEMAEGTTSLSWTINSEQAQSGPFELQFALPKFADVPKSPSLPGRLIDSWLEGFSPLVNGQQVEWPELKLDLMKGETIRLALDFNRNWLIGNSAGFLALEYTPGAEGRGLVFDPPLDTPCEMLKGTTSLSWTITSEQAQSGPFELQFGLPKLTGVPKSPSSPGRLIDSWLEGFSPLVNGRQFTWPGVKLDLMKGETIKLELDFKDNWLIGNPDGFLALEYTPGAEGRGLVFDPQLGTPIEMAEGSTSLSWTVTSEQAQNGNFELQFALPKFADVPKSPSLRGRSIDSWLEGFSPLVNGQKVEWHSIQLNMVGGESVELGLEFERNWLIGNPAGFLALEYLPGAVGQGLVFDPPLPTLRKMLEGTTSLSWMITSEQANSGPFDVRFGLPLLNVSSSSPLSGKVLNIAQEFEVKFDDFLVGSKSVSFPCIGAEHEFSLMPLPGCQLLGESFRLQIKNAPSGVQLIPILEMQIFKPEKLTYKLDCRKATGSGEFNVELMFVNEKQEITILLFKMSLGHNLVTVERWSEEKFRWPDIYWTEYFLLATSAFLKTPASGVRVNRAGSGYFATTSSDGVVSTGSASSGGRLEVVNPYDGSVV